ncbi:glycogen phosphorylase [Fodinibius salinus]|uniref:Alpha-1,4 glucan phosphorylase n=1 Tax=Fodinibius salinus TaxID=860790 RepID=A0A5D3YI32_9BACT|nr:glycogen/starch/alpha-glucan phosphorylase [Fodinibius salinus]TYP93443.1 glycogen phosphorylase [Fodinibius salinus]
MSTDPNISPRTGMDIDSFREDIRQHLHYTLAKDKFSSTEWDHYRSVVLAVMDRLHDRWINTQQNYYQHKSKRVYYLSMEYLIGRLMDNMLINLGLQDAAADAIEDLGLDYDKVREAEVDAGLGNGGLGRLAACFLDSMATLGVPGLGYGIRYDYGIFDQAIKDGWQVEKPDLWLQYGYPWSVVRPKKKYPVEFYGETTTHKDENGRTHFSWINTDTVTALAYDTPIPGFRNDVVNNLRLWKATSDKGFDLKSFNQGDYINAVRNNLLEENISRVLYPNDKVFKGQELRLKQEYFLVSASLQDAMNRFKKQFDDLRKIPQQMAVQCNDTHPNLAIPELMRVLMDQEGMKWEPAWDIVTQTVNYTNHTLMPEALEKWPLSLMSELLPRHTQIIREIDRRFLNTLEISGGEGSKQDRMRIISDEKDAMIRMGNLGIIGSQKVNGVSELHSRLMKETIFRDFSDIYDNKFTNVTNGVTPRRWLRQCNRPLADLITDRIGEEWITDLDQLNQVEQFAEDESFQELFSEIKLQNKKALAGYIKKTMDITVDPDAIFDIHIKRIHEYKRQLLALMHAITLYNRLKENPEADIEPRVLLFAGKAAPGYKMAQLYIKLINNVANTINNDPEVGSTLRVLFLQNYSVSLAEKMIPAADLSEQISTAGMEASGTGNMKFALNGALTIGTLDGANIEIREQVGKDNIFIFGHTVNEIQQLRDSGYDPQRFYKSDEELKKVIDQIHGGYFSPDQPDLFHPITNALLNQGDYFMILADYRQYIQKQREVEYNYRSSFDWNRKAIINIANMGYFSSDRAIKNYCKRIWDVEI